MPVTGAGRVPRLGPLIKSQLAQQIGKSAFATKAPKSCLTAAGQSLPYASGGKKGRFRRKADHAECPEVGRKPALQTFRSGMAGTGGLLTVCFQPDAPAMRTSRKLALTFAMTASSDVSSS